MKKAHLILLILLALAPWAWAQRQTVPDGTYKYAAGVNFGMSGYLGDANESNMFKHPGLAASLTFRYLPNSRWSFGGDVQLCTLSGNTAEWDNVLPEGRQYEFKSTNIDVAAKAEFNFFNYGMGETYKKYRRWTPYLSLGLGLNVASSDGSTAIAPSIPMGFGFRYKASQRINLQACFTMTRVFGDKVDGRELTDLIGIKSSFLKNNDWVSSITVGITYEFGQRCVTCHYID